MSRLEKCVIYNLRETYHELGRYEFKVSLNPRLFKTSQSFDVLVLNPEGKAIPCEVKHWGRKIHCAFEIDENVSDGVGLVKVVRKQDDQSEVVGRNTFWIIKV